jgi:hypothetical protein
MKKASLTIGFLVCMLAFGTKLIQAASVLETWCITKGQEWDVALKRCTVGPTAEVSVDIWLDIQPEESLANYGTIDNDTFIHNYGGNIDNYGTINNKGTAVENISGTINNFGTFNNDSYLQNRPETMLPTDGIFNNYGSINNNGTFYNHGTINNNSAFNNNGTITNNGTIESVGAIENNGTIESDGTIESEDTVENNGIINNHGEWYMVGTTINNYGGIIWNWYDGILYLYGQFDNFGDFINDGKIIYPNSVFIPLIMSGG